jgi:hypothetical protein
MTVPATTHWKGLIAVEGATPTHRTDVEAGFALKRLQFRARCSCGWVSDWYTTAGMASAVLSTHHGVDADET